MTNKEHLQSMSTEELTEWFFNRMLERMGGCPCDVCRVNFGGCKYGIKEWLESEVKE